MKKALFIAIVCMATPLWAADAPKSGIELSADSLQYHQKTNVVVAKGDVVATQNAKGADCQGLNAKQKDSPISQVVGRMGTEDTCSRTLKADTVRYDRNKDLITATGNVQLHNNDGSIYHADTMEITGDFKKGLINDFEAELASGGTFTANKVNYQEDKTKLKQATYTTCKKCEGKHPIWQIKADKILYNNEEQEVHYNDAWLEAYGVPIMYTPYFYHPTPDADRKTGFLIPKYRFSSDLGMQLTTPYYFNLAPNYDATLTPTFTTQEGIVLAGEFRHLLESGSYEFAGSATYPEKRESSGAAGSGNEFRGHIEGRGHFDLTEEWRWGFDGKRSSDDTYLEKYGFAYEDTLTSQLYLDRQDERSLFTARAITFQGLRADDDPGTTPLVLPLIDYNYESEPLWENSRFVFNVNGLTLLRDEGDDVNRLSVEGGWKIPRIVNGHVLEASLWLRGDMYKITDQWGDTTYEERLIPTAYLGWRYPLIRRGKANTLLIEPIAELVLSPNNVNNSGIANEDSLSLEFTDTNLFSRERHAGYDLVESGLRINYGLRYRFDVQHKHRLNGMIGQMYHDGDETYAFGSTGLEDNFSYVVGRVGYEYDDIFSLNYRYKLDNETLNHKRSEVNSTLSFAPIELELDYVSLTDDPTIPESEEILLKGAWDINDNWKLWGHARKDLKTDGMLENGISIGYENECVVVSVEYQKDFTSDRDIKGGSSIGLHIELKGMK